MINKVLGSHAHNLTVLHYTHVKISAQRVLAVPLSNHKPRNQHIQSLSASNVEEELIPSAIHLSQTEIHQLEQFDTTKKPINTSLPSAHPSSENASHTTSHPQYVSDPQNHRQTVNPSDQPLAEIILPKPSLMSRLWQMLGVTLIFAIFGSLLDWLTNLIKLFGSVGNAEMVWLFLPILTVLGLVSGWFFGTKAVDMIFGLFRTTPYENNPSNDDYSFSSGLLKAMGIGLLLGLMGWVLLLMLN
ncbi:MULTISPECIES: hypothetical protein [unclassified Moraxella]|uniref:hypothetical protein n=1 Tax=unclassified Moraxella TaxID=2685852 RepID=UPI003AF79340